MDAQLAQARPLRLTDLSDDQLDRTDINGLIEVAEEPLEVCDSASLNALPDDLVEVVKLPPHLRDHPWLPSKGT